eukprot:6205095-Pleurochrysis_carterae.AAC.3
MPEQHIAYTTVRLHTNDLISVIGGCAGARATCMHGPLQNEAETPAVAPHTALVSILELPNRGAVSICT